jgi:hypothetical protein
MIDPSEAPEGYVAVRKSGCSGCSFLGERGCNIPFTNACGAGGRKDKTAVIFIKKPPKQEPVMSKKQTAPKQTISMDKKYKTRDGRDVRLLCVDGVGHYPVVGYVVDVLTVWKDDGFNCIAGNELVEVKDRIKRFLTIYKSKYSTADFTYSLKTSRDESHYEDKKRIACIEIEFSEGDGL